MDDFLMQVTLYYDGTIRYAGRQLKHPGQLGHILRTIAAAADSGSIAWDEGGWIVEDD